MHQGKFDSVTIDAGEDLSANQYFAIAIDGTIADTAATAFGLIQNKPPSSGRRTHVAYAGQMKGRAGAAIALGASLTVTTSGFLITTSATSGSSTPSVGKALAAANSGDTFPGLFNFATADVTAFA